MGFRAGDWLQTALAKGLIAPTSRVPAAAAPERTGLLKLPSFALESHPEPRASEVRETVEAVERGLFFLRGLAKALERVERNATQATEDASNPETPPSETT